jgi:integrative and conjugative element protein (TIGR02256 family)
MQLLVTRQVIKRLQNELQRAQEQEIGGLLMGEHLQDELFRVVEISVQRSGGSQACFTRDPSEHRAHLQRFFARTGEDYTRFNYLGEWHSHPSFDPSPSTTDLHTMQSIVNDPAVGVNFLILLIVKLSSNKKIEATAMAFRASTTPVTVQLLSGTNSQGRHEKTTAYQWLRRIIGF